MKNISLNNTENYNDKINDNECTLFLKYIGLIHEMVETISENIYIQNKEYLKYIMIKAVNNVGYIYTFLLLYTKNLELAIFHTQRSILYYIEFIGQIGDDNHNILNLNSKDAILFSFKKTIFEINQEYRASYIETLETKNILENLNVFINIYNSIINKTIENNIYHDDCYNILQKIIFTNIYKISNNIIQYKINDDSFIAQINNINNIVSLINVHYEKSFIKNNYLNIIELLTKKGLKKNINYDNIKDKIEKSDIEYHVNDMSNQKIVNYLIS